MKAGRDLNHGTPYCIDGRVTTPAPQSSTVPSNVVAKVSASQRFDIHSEDAGGETGTESMCVVGQNPGEKRKQEHLEDAQRISQREAAERAQSEIVEVSPEGSVPAQPTVVDDSAAEIETDAEGIKATPIQLAPAQKSYDKFSDLQKDL